MSPSILLPVTNTPSPLHTTLDMAQIYSNELTAAAQVGDLATLRNLISHGAEVSERGDDDITPLMAAAMAGKGEAVTLLLDNGADAKGEAWLREKFRSTSDNVKDPASKPDRALWERLISGNLGPAEGRNASDVYWEHIGLCLIGDRPLDIERNYSKNLKQCRTGTFNQFFEGHEGLRQSAQLLHSKLPTTQYDIVETVVKQTNKISGWVTERWGYYDPENEVQVTDGIDTFLIENGKITVKWANYNVEDKVDPRSVYEEKVGTSGLAGVN
ncbi:Ankyrin repeat protein [Mycena venus]|uniref:Ankyrin repeat protein n=1 Tax=Mycena venus TaxID=2733690 RepID=A0A8H7D8Y6_9AGAR|nr:Ankyrin repeat protein [Mycena venus]